MDVNQLIKRIDGVKNNIRRACRKAGRDESEITLVAATKTVDKSVVDLLPDCGIFDAGENHANEFRDKYDPAVRLKRHFIGSLQTNKVKYLVGKCELIQSVDRVSLVDEIQRLSDKNGVITNVLVEVNVGREVSKSGVMTEQLDELIAYVLKNKNVFLKGLMTVLPIDACDELYDEMFEIYSSVKRNLPQSEILSMGMSADYEKAIIHGSNMVRVGSAIFGARIYNKV